MLEIKPIQEKSAQEQICTQCKTEYDADMLAYAAHADNLLLGVCQFRFYSNFALIKDLKPAPGTNDFEAMFLLARAAMNFIDLCGTHTARCTDKTGEIRLLLALGFQKRSTKTCMNYICRTFSSGNAARAKNKESRRNSPRFFISTVLDQNL